MLFGNRKDLVNSIYCDCVIYFDSPQLFEQQGFKMPDDFELADFKNVGNPRFQIIRDLKNNWCFCNHDGNLYPFTKTRILTRDYKIKKSVIEERFGKRNPFHADSIWFFETGFHYGEIDFMTFFYPYKKDEMPITAKHRKIIYKFPLFWFMSQVLELEEQKKSRGWLLNSTETLENEKKILSQKELKGWQLDERDVTPSEDYYSEHVEHPLNDYCFHREHQEYKVYFQLHLEFFYPNK